MIVRWPERVFAAATALTVAGAATERLGWQRVAKPLLAPALAARVWRDRERHGPTEAGLLIGSLAAATVGDVLLLEPDDDRRLARGAAAFAVMQAGYAAVFRRRGARPTAPAAVPRGVAWAGVAALLRVQAPGLARPLSGYGLTLGTATTLASDPALAPGSRVVRGLVVPDTDPRSRYAFGALLFTLSDGMIVARRQFLRSPGTRRAAEAAILASYAGAQYLLTQPQR
ncbi:lysoplasmalogenase [Skermania piniformis]|uniref:Lysoplasmalogenase n=1 Tax=Skermania pinensis TaxID=39122 RepID=A0ABX8SFB6_9ACTN|nr:lysoplasmalogenase [Skermania piniformis]QXQ16041.1 lysoplasmalogenase [Skermania piniformis]